MGRGDLPHAPIRSTGARVAGGLVIVAALAFAPAAFAQTPDAPRAAGVSPDAAGRRAEFDAALGAGEQKRAEKLLTEAFGADPGWAREACAALVSGPDSSRRPLGAVLLSRHGAPADAAALARSLDQQKFPDERRRLVRALGVRAARQEDTRPALELVRPFLKDRDFLVRAAAAGAVADLARPEGVVDLIDAIEKVPAYVNSDTVDEREIFRRAACGAVRALTGLRPRSAAEVRRWLADTGNGTNVPRRVPPAARGGPEVDVWNGQDFALAPGFDLYLRITGMKSLPTDGPLAWASIVKGAEGGARAATQQLERVAGGPVYMPIPRLYLCDTREFSARAGVTFFQGVTKSNEIVIKIDPPGALAGTMAHEYVHWIHQNLYNDQPRWISEGLATSFATSFKESVWKGRSPEGELKKMIERGPFTELFNWNSSGSSDSKEASRYALSHLAVDFLRFGEFSVSEERLAFFMGKIARRQSPTKALLDTYGVDAKAMDRAALEWLRRSGD